MRDLIHLETDVSLPFISSFWIRNWLIFAFFGGFFGSSAGFITNNVRDPWFRIIIGGMSLLLAFVLGFLLIDLSFIVSLNLAIFLGLSCGLGSIISITFGTYSDILIYANRFVYEFQVGISFGSTQR